MLATAITNELARRNGGPGMTAPELSQVLGVPLPVVRNSLSGLVFRSKTVTCEGKDGRYRIGNPAPILDKTKFPQR